MFYIFSAIIGTIGGIVIRFMLWLETKLKINEKFATVLHVIFGIVMVITFQNITYEHRPESKILYILGSSIMLVIMVLIARIKVGKNKK